jgi:hypothetical protein
MFKRMRYVFAVNGSLAALGINPQSVDPAYRRGCQEIGLLGGLSPQEVATFIATQLPLGERPASLRGIVALWEREGKVSPGMFDACQGAKSLTDARVMMRLMGART